LAAGKTLIDTTCPLVTRAHKAALMLRDEGYHVIVIGKRNHVEVNGFIEDLPSHEVVERPEDVRRRPHLRIGVVCQTTARACDVAAIRKRIEELNPGSEIRFIDTVCQPTKDHQRSLEELLDRVDAMVVVGGRNSNNTRQLAKRSNERGVPALHIESADELDPRWFDDVEIVGLTAGTSTLEPTINEVYEALLGIAAAQNEQVAGAI
jgi:4-hydroxy-3-methylbut-2-en-1-yl diphosphate reductase